MYAENKVSFSKKKTRKVCINKMHDSYFYGNLDQGKAHIFPWYLAYKNTIPLYTFLVFM